MNPNGIHLVIRLPYNRPSEDTQDPPPIEWTPEKENLLWEVIARSRASDSGGTDWPALSEHLKVPLPYLLYRAQTRYEEDLRGLQDINKAALNLSTNTTALEPHAENKPRNSLTQRTLTPRSVGNQPSATPTRSRQGTPHGRLTSPLKMPSPGAPFGQPSQPAASGSGTISSLIMTHKPQLPSPLSPRRHSPLSSASSSPSSSDGETEEQQRQEEREAVGRRLKELEKLMSSDNLGFARPKPTTAVEVQPKFKRRISQQPEPLPQRGRESTSGSPSTQSIPSIPSPGSESPHSVSPAPPPARSREPGFSRSPPAVTTRFGRTRTKRSDRSSSNAGSASNASSFSDLSDASVTASALEDALMSNFRSGGSRLSMFTRSHFGRPTAGGASHS